MKLNGIAGKSGRVLSISIPRKQAKRLGLAEFQDRGASAKSESATSSRIWDGSIRSVRRISVVSQTPRRSCVNRNQGSASFNNGTIPDVLFLYPYTTPIVRFTSPSRFDFCELTHELTLVHTLSCNHLNL